MQKVAEREAKGKRSIEEGGKRRVVRVLSQRSRLQLDFFDFFSLFFGPIGAEKGASRRNKPTDRTSRRRRCKVEKLPFVRSPNRKSGALERYHKLVIDLDQASGEEEVLQLSASKNSKTVSCPSRRLSAKPVVDERKVRQ